MILIIEIIVTDIGAKYMGARVLEHPLKIFIGCGAPNGQYINYNR
jgi:hypothetical protein